MRKSVERMAQEQPSCSEDIKATEVVSSLLKSMSELQIEEQPTAEELADARRRVLESITEKLESVETKLYDQAPYNATIRNLTEFLQESDFLTSYAIDHPEDMLRAWRDMPTRYLLIKMEPAFHKLALDRSKVSDYTCEEEERETLIREAKMLDMDFTLNSLRMEIGDKFFTPGMVFARKTSPNWYYVMCVNHKGFGAAEFMKFSFNSHGEILRGVEIQSYEYYEIPSQESHVFWTHIVE